MRKKEDWKQNNACLSLYFVFFSPESPLPPRETHTKTRHEKKKIKQKEHTFYDFSNWFARRSRKTEREEKSLWFRSFSSFSISLEKASSTTSNDTWRRRLYTLKKKKRREKTLRRKVVKVFLSCDSSFVAFILLLFFPCFFSLLLKKGVKCMKEAYTTRDK